MSLVFLRFICLTHPPCLRSAFEMPPCVFVTLTCAGVCARLMDTPLLPTSLLYGACKHNDAHCIDFLVPFYNYVSPLFIHALSPAFSLLSCLSYLPPLSSVFLIPSPWSIFMPHCARACYLGPFSFFPVWSQLLNFLSHLRHSAWFRFAPPSLPLLRWLSLCLFLLFVLFFSLLPFLIVPTSLYNGFHTPQTPFSVIFFHELLLKSLLSSVFLCSLSGVHTIFTIAWRSRTN